MKAGMAVDRLASGLALSALAALLIVGGSTHEAWFDEAQAWLIARDNNPWTMLTGVVRYEGTPGLWHLVLWAFQRLGGEFRYLWLVSTGLALFGAGLTLFCAPFPIWLRVGLVFCYFAAYQFAVVARSYAIDLVLFPVLAVLFPSRTKHTLAYAFALGLLANTNAHSFVFSAALALECGWACRPWDRMIAWPQIAAFGLYVLMSLGAAAQAFPPADVSFLARGASPYYLLTETFINQINPFSAQAPSDEARLAGFALSVMIILPIAALSSAAGLRFVFWSLLLGFLLFSAAQNANLWHSGLLWLSFMFVIWIGWGARSQLSHLEQGWLTGALAVMVFYHLSYSVQAWSADLERPYSAAPQAARALAAHRAAHPNDRIAAIGVKAFSIQPWFSSNVFANYNQGQPHPSYYLWSSHNTLPPDTDEASVNWVFSSGHYDWVLASAIKYEHEEQFARLAGRYGYCIFERIPGNIIWKNYNAEPDGIVIFHPCAASEPF